MTKQRLIYISLAAAISYLILGTRYSHDMVEFALETAAGTASAPFRFRILSAYLFAGAAEVLGASAALWLYWFILLGAFAPLMDEWLRKWMPPDRAMAGVFLALLLSYAFIYFQSGGALWSGTEALIWLVALLILHSERVWWLVPLVFVATLNRETALLLVPLGWLITRNWKLTGAMALAWAVTYGALRLSYPGVACDYTLAYIWHENTGTFKLYHFVLGAALFGWLPLFAIQGYRQAPAFLRRAVWAAVPFLAAIAVFGMWREFRLFLPLLPLLLPLVMGAEENVADDSSPAE